MKQNALLPLRVSALLTLTLFSLCSCSRYAPPEEGFQRITNDSVEYAFECPSDWIVTRDDAMIAIKSPDNGDNLSVTSFAAQDPALSPERYLDGYRELFASAFGEMTVLAEESTDLAGFPARRLSYANAFAGENYRGDMIVSIHNGVIYTVTFTASPDTYEQSAAVLDRARKTFSLK